MSTPTINMSVEDQKKLFAKLLADKQKADRRALRLRVKNQILVNKAKAANITVSDAEIDDYINNMK